MRRQGPPRAAVFTLLALPAILLTGCGNSGSGDSGSGSGSGSSGDSADRSPSPRTTSDTEICVNLVSYWARQVFEDRADSGRDFMQKGLSNGQNNILITAVTAAKAERERHGTAAAHELMDRQIRQKCTERYRHGKPTDGIWREPTPTNSSR